MGKFFRSPAVLIGALFVFVALGVYAGVEGDGRLSTGVVAAMMAVCAVVFVWIALYVSRSTKNGDGTCPDSGVPRRKPRALSISKKTRTSLLLLNVKKNSPPDCVWRALYFSRTGTGSIVGATIDDDHLDGDNSAA
jgi:hypothetical protein